jgi:hypothetical protein
MDQDESGRGGFHVEADLTEVSLERYYKLPTGLERQPGCQMWMALSTGRW